MKTGAAPESAASSTATGAGRSPLPPAPTRDGLEQLPVFRLGLLQSCLDSLFRPLAIVSQRHYYCLESLGPGQLMAKMPSRYCYSEAPCRGNIK